MSEATPEQKEQLWNEFLQRWPLENLKDMTLAEYNSAGTQDSFSYWLEFKTRPLGGIAGGSSFKFGVYELKNKSAKPDKLGNRYNDSHGWREKYGNSPDEAFAAVMEQVIQAAEGARAGDLDAVDSADLWLVLRWKIAFLYQDPNNLQIAPVYSDKYIRALLGQPNISVRDGHRALMSQRGEQSVFAYGTQLNQRIQELEESTFTTDKAKQYLDNAEFLASTKTPTKKLAGYQTTTDDQLALNLTGKNPVRLFLSPGAWQESIQDPSTKLKDYPPGKSRHSNLSSITPKLAQGQPAVMASVATMEALLELCEAYSGEATMADAESVATQANTRDSLMQNQPLNQILYGPPGTGKTYETTRLAVSIADPEWMEREFDVLGDDLAEQRAALKTRYLELVEDQRIVFTTFHQSFSYEDFVEGIRPETDEDSGTLNYSVSDGIFKTLCLSAQSTVVQNNDDAISLEGRRIWKMSLGNTLKDDDDIYEECLEEGYVLLGYGGDLDFRDCDDRQTVKAHIEKQWGKPIESNDYTLTSVNAFKNQMQHGDLIVVSDGNHKFRAIAEVTGDYQYLSPDDRARYQQMRPVRWLRQYDPSLPKDRLFKKSLSQMTLYELKPKTVDHQKLQHLLEPEARAQAEKKPHVLIIDEINRGNISRIFGELITLLEPSKRKGAHDEQSARLPYSKEPFSVPENVHIIGTMNTADKSLAQMDLALRRRFSFIETPPDPSLLKGVTVHGVNMAQLLETINQRIEVLLDAEHMIGHAYFMPLLSLDDEASRQRTLASIFKDKIIPLLQEYFFDDYERIGWVINGSTKEHEHQFIQSHNAAALPALTKLFPNGVADQLADRRFRINRAACDKAEAYQGIVA